MLKPVSSLAGFDSHTLRFEKDSIELDCYLKGSLLGGTGTECFHKVGGEKLAEFLAAQKVGNLTELRAKAESLDEAGWSKFHQSVMKFSTDNFVWSDMDWSD